MLMLLVASLLACALGLAGANAFAEGKKRGIPVYKKTFFSQPYHVDTIYKSMQGPQSTLKMTLRPGPTELLWVTAYRTEIVGPDSDEAMPPDFMCHNNLNLGDLDRHRDDHAWHGCGQ